MQDRPDETDRLEPDAPSGLPADPMAPGSSVDDDEADDPPDQAVEPNEPA